mmetsp:Transcript_29852/g.95502  ORF Transcript_29852/g.95502 Transcript_29852/m.95502 type:complete len:282 (-) Transcript_29852:620-1465(-)
MRWHDFVRPALAKAVRARLSVLEPNAMQCEALRPAMRGEDLLLVAQTGSGKTLALLLPLLESVTRAVEQRPSAARTALLLAPSDVLVEQHAATARTLLAGLDTPVELDCDTGASLTDVCGLLEDASRPSLLVATAAGARRRLEASGGAGREWAARLAAVAIDEADAVLCGRPHDTALRPDADALLDALPAGKQHLLATAFLTSEHEVALTRRFRRAVRVSEHSTAGQRGVMVPTLRQLFRYLGPGASREVALLLPLPPPASASFWPPATPPRLCDATVLRL